MTPSREGRYHKKRYYIIDEAPGEMPLNAREARRNEPNHPCCPVPICQKDPQAWDFITCECGAKCLHCKRNTIMARRRARR